jgi:hypothetical protein
MVNFYSQQNRNGNGNIIPESSAKKSGKSKINIEKYIDPTGEFGSKQYKQSLWFVQNKLLLYRLLVSFLIIFSIITVGYSLWKGLELLIYELTIKSSMEQQLAHATNYGALNAAYTPSPIDILSTQIYTGGTDKIDIVSEVTNINERYVARFDYYYDFNGVKTASQSAVLLPTENRPLGALGLDSAEFSGSANLILTNVRFTRVDNHAIPDLPAWMEERLNFGVDNFVYTPADSNLSANSVKFTLTDNSPYGYRAPNFYLELYQNGGLIGLMKFDTTDLQSQESREIDLRNFVPNLSVSEVKLYPLIDLFDDSVYLAPKR